MMDNCWYFAGTHMKNGYGWFAGAYAHRQVFEAFHRPLNKGELVRHRCDVRVCINPDHLEAGSLIDNVQDMVARGRSAKGERHSQSKLTEGQVREIRSLKGKISNTAIARIYEVHRTCIDKINRGHHWRHI